MVFKQEGCMKRSKGFLLIEITITIALISCFFVIIAGYLAQIIQWQVESRIRIEAVNCASSCLELMRQKKSYKQSENKSHFKITIEKQRLFSLGHWSRPLHSQEFRELKDHFNLVFVTVEWSSDRKQLCQLISGVVCDDQNEIH